MKKSDGTLGNSYIFSNVHNFNFFLNYNSIAHVLLYKDIVIEYIIEQSVVTVQWKGNSIKEQLAFKIIHR